jgi:hypothetical protein
MTALMSVLGGLQPFFVGLVIALGVAYLWIGLFGWPAAGGLLRRGATALQRMEGFRAAMFGLVVGGIGLGWLLESKLLLVLFLGMGIAELREATLIIDAVKARRSRPRPSSPEPIGKAVPQSQP